jgi:integration host factor subunit alpha
MAITKAHIVEAVQKQIGFSMSQASDIVETILETMKSTLEQGEKLKISGFGNFTPRNKRTRVGRNPKTGEAINISARRVVTFKASPVLKALMNRPTSPKT